MAETCSWIGPINEDAASRWTCADREIVREDPFEPTGEYSTMEATEGNQETKEE